MDLKEINSLLGEKNKTIEFNKKTKLVSPVDIGSVESERNNLFERGKSLLGFNQPAQSQSIPEQVMSLIPQTPEFLKKAIHSASSKYNIPSKILSAQGFAESGYRPEVMSGKQKSSAGAIGAFQFMPNTLQELKRLGYPDFDPTDPEQSAHAAAFYLRTIADRTTGGNINESLKAYNAGEGNYRKYKGDIPFNETKNYVKKITDLAK